ncbi:MAG: 3-oxoacyl-[acyl-carrier-protein] reductase [Candidatus Omnitrophica bacterium]|nr:3-oxoacyl-[acyl-carrier-protein] reductase [Candidatus Omnitrophota bacterium]MBU1924351.1 3-oxoacyl-[acyl-carrier-protein] reductase [Candidatus Omnitrophota bacterium]MBU2063954.1 3-oxoacyl-[acyl-carrier-protein] reductase [Candidatus Omnitrophota bacterium]
MKFKDKIAVVTGGTRGIGKAVVRELAGEKAHVLFTYLNNDSLAKELESEFKTKVIGFKVDVKNFSDVDKWKEKVLDKFGKVDILVNNAGILRDKALAMMTQEDWKEVIDTNLTGVFNVTRAFIVQFMKQKSGNIINMSSLSGIIGIPRQTNYSATKGGIIAFSKSLAKEVAAFGIRVNVVAPGFIDTDMTKSLKEDYIKQITPQIPLARFGSAEEVAKVVSFLASDDSDYITGQVFRIDGGLGM